MSNKTKKKNSLGIIIKSLFMGSNQLDNLSVMEEEEMASPFRTVVKNFLSNKIAMTGAITFCTIFILTMTLPIFYPLDTTFQDSTQQNVAPGFSMLSMPKSLQSNLSMVTVGATFSMGIDDNGYLYQWGQMPSFFNSGLPEGMGQLEQVSAGLDHALGLGLDGKVYTWGNTRLGIGSIPVEVQNAEDIVKVFAGNQQSFAITNDGRVYVWGNQNLINISVPAELQGKAVDVYTNSTTAMAISTDGMVYNLTTQTSPFSTIPEEIQGNTVELAMTVKAVAALSDDGYVTFWGNLDSASIAIPEEIQGTVVDISAGRSHFSAVTSDGRVYSWGTDVYGESSPPNITNAVSVTSGYYQNYVETSDNTVETWGLKGYLMGSDHFGRNVALRLATGGRLTITIGAVAVIIQTTIGVLVGGMAGFYGGKIDNILMRCAEVVGAIPFIPLAMILSAVIGSNISENARIFMIMIILGLLSWPGLARLIRGQVLAEREKEFVTAAKAMGLQEHVIIFKHILPNVITVIIVSVTLSFASSMLTETSLSFLGFGVVEPNATWGNMLTGSQSSIVIRDYWWRWVFPALALGLSTISINLIGDGLRNAIDPKSNER